MEPNYISNQLLIEITTLQTMEDTLQSMGKIQMNSVYNGKVFEPVKRGMITYNMKGEWRVMQEQLEKVHTLYKTTLDNLTTMLYEAIQNHERVGHELNHLKNETDALINLMPTLQKGLSDMKKEFLADPGIATMASKKENFAQFIDTLSNDFQKETTTFNNLVKHLETDNRGNLTLSQ